MAKCRLEQSVQQTRHCYSSAMILGSRRGGPTDIVHLECSQHLPFLWYNRPAVHHEVMGLVKVLASGSFRWSPMGRGR